MRGIFKRLFDYEIVGEYYDRVPQANGTITRVRKHIKKFYCVPLRKLNERRKGGKA